MPDKIEIIDLETLQVSALLDASKADDWLCMIEMQLLNNTM